MQAGGYFETANEEINIVDIKKEIVSFLGHFISYQNPEIDVWTCFKEIARNMKPVPFEIREAIRIEVRKKSLN